MTTTSITPSIGLTIGRYTRLYYAYITAAPATLDAPSTMTLHKATLADVAGLACEELTLDRCRAKTVARLVLMTRPSSVGNDDVSGSSPVREALRRPSPPAAPA